MNLLLIRFFSLLVGGFLFLNTLPVYAFTVQGTLYNNTRWSKAMSPILLSGDVTINKGVTLTIDAGVVVQAAKTDGLSAGSNKTKVELIVQGTLIANATSSSSILFTGLNKLANSWYGVRVESGGQLTLNHVKIEYA